MNCEGMRVVVPGKQHSGESCSSLSSSEDCCVHLEGMTMVGYLTQQMMIFSYLHAFAAARSQSPAGKESNISTHRPEHAAACRALASVLADGSPRESLEPQHAYR